MGDQGGARVHVKDYAKEGDVTLFNDLNGSRVETKPRIYEQHEHGRVISRFIDSILLGVPMSPSGEEGLDRIRVIDAIYASAEAQREVAFATAAVVGV